MFNIQDLVDDAKCYAEVRKLGWPKGVQCPKCGSTDISKRGFHDHQPHRQRYRCRTCRKQFDDLTETIFEGHHQPLKVWVVCLYWMGLNLSNQQIAQELELNPTITPPPPVSPTLSTPSSPAPTLTPQPLPMPPPSPLLSPTISPLSTPIVGIVIAESLNVRRGPSTNYQIVTGLKIGDEVTIFRRTPVGAEVGNWLEIETLNKIKGWVVARYVRIFRDEIPPTATVGPTPSSNPTRTPTGLPTLDLRGNSVSGRIASHQEQWYAVSVVEHRTVLVLMFTPNVNFYGNNFQAFNVQFFIHDQNQLPFGPPGELHTLERRNVGVGSLPVSDRDGNLGTGELIWDSATLPKGVSFFLRIVNSSDSDIQYCLAPRDQYEWSCLKN